MNKNIKNIIIHTFILLLIAMPFFSFAVDKPLVPCIDDCNFSHIMQLINNIVDFILFKMALPISAIMFAYAGFLLLFSGGEQAKRTKAKEIFVNVALGLAFALAAWLIVNTILSILGFKDAAWLGF